MLSAFKVIWSHLTYVRCAPLVKNGRDNPLIVFWHGHFRMVMVQ